MDERIEIQHKFDDFAECTEYYYDELGNLEAVRDNGKSLSRKEVKKMHQYIMTSFLAAMDNLKDKAKAQAKVEKTEVKEFNKAYTEEHNLSKWRPFKSAMQVMLKPAKAIGNKAAALLKHKKKPEPEVVQIADEQAEMSFLKAPEGKEKNEENSQKENENNGKDSDAKN